MSATGHMTAADHMTATDSRRDDDEAEVLIIGGGASGAAVAWRLAGAGIDVVCLERGGWMDPDAAPQLGEGWEAARHSSHHPDPNRRRLPEDYAIVVDDTPITPLLYNGVGGSTLHWGGQFPRLRPSDFAVHTLDGVADDWPLSYDDLVHHYDLNDQVMGIAGITGDPANPPRSPRQTPPVPLGRGGDLLAAAFDRLGWHWWPSDVAINTRPYRGRGACNNCGPCHLHCPLRARSSTDVTYWPEALTRGARLITQARVTEITTDTSGRVTGARWRDAEGRAHHQRARTVVMACNGIGTPRLLLASASAGHPDGLANRSGLVGRRLMHHPTAMATGVFDERIDGYKGPYAAALLSQHFYETDPSRDFVRGYQLQMLRSNGPVSTALGDYLPRTAWGRGHHAAFAERFARTVTLTVTTEDLPDPENRVTLDRRVDDDGVPLPRVAYRVDDNARRMIAHGLGSASTVLREAGATRVIEQPLVAQAGFHLLGTARMGDDPSASVVDAYGRAHDVDNLFVVDGSTFVTCGAVNPTSTIQALALRTADHLIETARSGLTRDQVRR